jgi:hypothetical protein
MRSLLVVCLHPCIEIGLSLLQCPIDLLPKRDAIELVHHGLVESLADPVGLGMLRLRPCMIDVLDGQLEFVLMPLGCSTVLGPMVGQDPAQGDVMLLEER